MDSAQGTTVKYTLYTTIYEQLILNSCPLYLHLNQKRHNNIFMYLTYHYTDNLNKGA